MALDNITDEFLENRKEISLETAESTPPNGVLDTFVAEPESQNDVLFINENVINPLKDTVNEIQQYLDADAHRTTIRMNE